MCINSNKAAWDIIFTWHKLQCLYNIVEYRILILYEKHCKDLFSSLFYKRCTNCFVSQWSVVLQLPKSYSIEAIMFILCPDLSNEPETALPGNVKTFLLPPASIPIGQWNQHCYEITDVFGG